MSHMNQPKKKKIDRRTLFIRIVAIVLVALIAGSALGAALSVFTLF